MGVEELEIEWKNGKRWTGWKVVPFLPFALGAFLILVALNQAELFWNGKHVYGKSRHAA